MFHHSKKFFLVFVIFCISSIWAMTNETIFPNAPYFIYINLRNSIDTGNNPLDIISNINNEKGKTILMFALREHRYDIAKLLATNRDIINLKDMHGNTHLINAIKENNQLATSFLIEHNTDVNIQDNDGYTPLIHAIQNKNDVIAKLLLESKTNINLQDNDGYTPLIHAIQNENYDMAKLLIDNKASVDSQDNDGYTPLIYAVQNQNYDMTKFLLENGANVNLANKQGNTPFLCAIHSNMGCDVAYLLIESNANTNLKNYQGNIQLIAAPVTHKNCEMLKLVVKLGAPIKFETREEKELLELAVLNNDYDTAKFLIKNNAESTDSLFLHSFKAKKYDMLKLLIKNIKPNNLNNIIAYNNKKVMMVFRIFSHNNFSKDIRKLILSHLSLDNDFSLHQVGIELSYNRLYKNLAENKTLAKNKINTWIPILGQIKNHATSKIVHAQGDDQNKLYKHYIEFNEGFPHYLSLKTAKLELDKKN